MIKRLKQLLPVKNNGFTLIELLIVIAILGVLAAVVLVAIDPVEQLARARDAGRKSVVGQMGRSMQGYFTANNQFLQPSAGNAWQSDMVTSGDLKAAQTAPTGTAACTAARSQLGYCYEANAVSGSGADATIWVILESKSEVRKAGGACATDPVGNKAAYVWSGSAGRSGFYCIGQPSTADLGVPAPALQYQ